MKLYDSNCRFIILQTEYQITENGDGNMFQRTEESLILIVVHMQEGIKEDRKRRIDKVGL
jgi:hypothetical protein